MKVKDLIDKLKACDMEKPVMYIDNGKRWNIDDVVEGKEIVWIDIDDIK